MKPYRKNFIESVPKGLIKFAPEDNSFQDFCSALQEFIDKINSSTKTNQTEENLKGHLKEFLWETFYKNTNAIEPKSYKGQIQTDYVIFQTNQNNSPVEVIIEAKKPDNKQEMVSTDNLNKKALHEAIFYFLFEKVIYKNNGLKHLIITNFKEFYIFDAQDIARLFFYEGNKLAKEFTNWQNKVLDSSNTSLFYSIVQSFVDQLSDELPFSYLNLDDLATCLSRLDKDDSKKKLIQAYKILCPYNLLKKPVSNDSNTLNREFYDELLHIIGLEEKSEKGKKLIQRKPVEKRNEGSFIEDLINKMQRGNKLRKVDNLHKWGQNTDEQLFNIALELSITWINRILFLKLLEAQITKYHLPPNPLERGNLENQFLFLNTKKIHSWSDLSFLFFEVLAKKTNERVQNLKGFDLIPYLNSSLFKTTDLEEELDSIDYLTQDATIPVFEKTVLKDSQNQRLKNTELTTLEYLLSFLSAYDFGIEDSEEIKKESKTLINASVLGLIFEKINGYKDGSFFTPGYITMYMCRETIRRAVLDKFNQKYELNCQSIEELNKEIYRNRISEVEANELIDNLRICDPAVGSGHFLVSALNEILSIKSDLDILIDTDGKQLGKYYKAYVENDELLIIDLESNESFNYKVASFDKNQVKRQVGLEKTRVQKTIFHEKQKIIENCLFGVDINPNSVHICRLRLWIELLKNAYYIPETDYLELQTLPNIDINIKQGNSLISRYSLDEHLNDLTPSPSPKSERGANQVVKDYLKTVQEYKNSTDKTKKEKLTKRIQAIKEAFHVDLFKNNKVVAKKNKKISDLNKLHQRLQGYSSNLLGSVLSESDLKKRKREENNLKKEIEKMEIEIDTIEAQIQEVKEGRIYKTGFEWRFEFPEVLDEKGDFIGFDIVIGNPPYIRQEEIKDLKPYLRDKFEIFNSIADIYTYFIERANSILNTSGHFSFIISNKFTRANYGENLKNYLLKNTQLNSFIDFSGIPVFDNATVDAAILSFKKSTSPPSPLTLTGKGEQDVKTLPVKGVGGYKFQDTHFEHGGLKYSQALIEQADKMRKEPTAAEKYLWDNLLRSSQLGVKFTRQKPIHNFILDFYCSELLLGIEADGDIHELQQEQDQLRTEYLATLRTVLVENSAKIQD